MVIRPTVTATTLEVSRAGIRGQPKALESGFVCEALRRDRPDVGGKPVPLLPHELEPVGRVGHDGVHARRLEAAHELDAVADEDHARKA
jgi:hypothetical protein